MPLTAARMPGLIPKWEAELSLQAKGGRSKRGVTMKKERRGHLRSRPLQMKKLDKDIQAVRQSLVLRSPMSRPRVLTVPIRSEAQRPVPRS